MAKALQLTGGDDVVETVRFITMMDKFFDCLNVNNFSTGNKNKKPFKQPYRSADDFRLTVCAQNVSVLCIISFFFSG